MGYSDMAGPAGGRTRVQTQVTWAEGFLQHTVLFVTSHGAD